MVSKRLTVITRAFGSDDAFKWESEGLDGYSITSTSKDTFGTDVILTLKDNAGEDNYDEFR